MKSTREGMRWSVGKIVRAAKSYACWNGFSGETCGACKATANVLGRGAGWSCPCGHYNVQSWYHQQMPHRSPTYGPSQKTIRRAVAVGMVDEVLALCQAAGIPATTVAPAWSYFGTFKTDAGPVHIELERGFPKAHAGKATHPSTRAAEMRAAFRAIRAA